MPVQLEAGCSSTPNLKEMSQIGWSTQIISVRFSGKVYFFLVQHAFSAFAGVEITK